MKSSNLVLINVLVILLIVAGGGAAVYYYMQSVNYISTDNARVDGQAVSIAAPADGVLSDWTGAVGQTFTPGQRVGAVRTPAGTTNITASVKGTVVQQSAVVGSIVGAGTPLARTYDLDSLWVTANIKETRIRDVKADQVVDVYVDAYPGTTLTGKISQIGLATAGTFSLLPASNTSSNYTKVTQVIPVTVTIDNYRGVGLLPGMNARIRIHK
ncbi:efflux RND transporter periplasmic adaptor subunit [Cohnella caldifontis]|uniref:efflux RND transporter periplasmic adaptor subunit n=1 Tax=Cohnella caldifontis TaxID=3027471 RepID=UPI0023EC170E|nr:efflux RND transporter periplasmic adaptor subunit [Cohnella sp. YIM B05605]